MDVEIGPPAAFSQANPRTMHLPARTLPTPSMNQFHNQIPNSNLNSNSNVNASYSNYDLLQYQQQRHNLDVGRGMRKVRKRKAESQDNERLSKRLSLLNLEKNGQKLYIPVESPQLRPTESPTLTQIPEDDAMQLDNSKHKVYIYNIDDELSSGDESDAEGRLVFLPDIEKHLMQNRIPPSVMANKDGEIAGMQLVLYSEPSSLTVPKEQDSVRKAIIEARQRVREKQKEEREQQAAPPTTPSSTSQTTPATSAFNGFTNYNGTAMSQDDNDPDAMDVD